MEYYIYRGEDELYHWGVKGMKWGVRRYQNKDGSLNNAGKKRRAKLDTKRKKLERKINKLDGVDKNDDSPRKKTVGEMTNAELKAATERMNVEKNYYEAQKNLLAAKPVQVSRGKQFAEKFLTEAVVPSVTDAAKSYISKELKKRLGIKDDVKINWDDKTKEQTYYKNEANKVYDDLKRANDIFEEQNRRQNMENGVFGDAARKQAAKKNGTSNSSSETEKSTDQTGKTDNAKKTTDQKTQSASETGAKGMKGEKWEKKSSEKVYEGTVEGVGNSSKRNTKSTQSNRNSTVIDAEWYEVAVSSVPSTVANRGQSYIAGLLEEPKGLSRR